MNFSNRRGAGLRFAVTMGVMFSLGGCSLFNSKDEGQGVATSLPSLAVPPDLITPATNPRYQALPATPQAAGQVAGSNDVAMPQGGVKSGAEVMPQWFGVERMRDGQRRWLLVNAAPDQVWGQVKLFLENRGYVLAQDEPALGFVETAWKDRAEGDEGFALQGWRESLRVRVEPAQEAGKTEINLSQKSGELVDGQWLLRSADADRAIEMLNRLARFLAENKIAPAQSTAPVRPLPAVPMEPVREMTEAEKAAIDKRWKEIEEECALCRPR